MLKIKTLFEILPTEADRNQFIEMLKRTGSNVITTRQENLIQKQFITDYLGGDDYKEIQTGGETANTEAIPNVEGIDKMTMHDLFFRRLAARHSGEENFSLSCVIQRLNACQTVDEVDALGAELFSGEWPVATIQTMKSLCRDKVGKWKIEGIAKAFPLFTQPFPYPELYSHVPDLSYYVKDLTEALLFLNIECSCGGSDWPSLLKRYLNEQDESLTDTEKGKIRGFEHYLLLVLICIGAGRMYEKEGHNQFWQRAWRDTWSADDKDDAMTVCTEKFVIQHGLEDDYLELAKHGRMDLNGYGAGFGRRTRENSFHMFCAPVFDHSLRDYALCNGLTSVNNILKPLLKGEFIRHCILDGANQVKYKAKSVILDAPTKRVDYKTTGRLFSLFMPDTYSMFLDSSQDIRSMAVEDFRNRVGYWTVSKELAGDYSDYSRPDTTETDVLLHIKQSIKHPESNIPKEAFEGEDNYKPCFNKDNPITEEDIYQGAARVVLPVLPGNIYDMSTYFNEDIIPTLILVRTSHLESYQTYYFCVDTEEHKQLLEGLIDLVKNNSSESERAGICCKIAVRKEIQDKMWLSTDAFKDRAFQSSHQLGVSTFALDMLKETVLIRLLCSKAMWDETCFDKGENTQLALFGKDGPRLRRSYNSPNQYILEVNNFVEAFASDEQSLNHCFVKDDKIMYRRRGVISLEDKLCRLRDDGLLEPAYAEESGLYALSVSERLIGVFYLSEGYAMYVRYEEIIDMCPAVKETYDKVSAMSEDDLKISAQLWLLYGYK